MLTETCNNYEINQCKQFKWFIFYCCVDSQTTRNRISDVRLQTKFLVGKMECLCCP
jgi:hypothetical protein